MSFDAATKRERTLYKSNSNSYRLNTEQCKNFDLSDYFAQIQNRTAKKKEIRNQIDTHTLTHNITYWAKYLAEMKTTKFRSFSWFLFILCAFEISFGCLFTYTHSQNLFLPLFRFRIFFFSLLILCVNKKATRNVVCTPNIFYFFLFQNIYKYIDIYIYIIRNMLCRHEKEREQF